MTPRTLFPAWLALALAVAAPRAAVAAPPREVPVTATRVHLGDVMPEADAAIAGVDVGPSPAAGGSRLLTKADIVAALEARAFAVPPNVPEAVRVVRRARHLAATEMNAIVHDALEAKPIARGVKLAGVRADKAVDVADGWTRVDVEVPRPPKKAGNFATTGIVSFYAGDEVVARVAVPLDLAVSEDGALYDTTRGAAITLVIRKNLVEVRAAAFAGADADVGDFVPAQLRPSGRVVRARLISKDEALAEDASR